MLEILSRDVYGRIFLREVEELGQPHDPFARLNTYIKREIFAPSYRVIQALPGNPADDNDPKSKLIVSGFDSPESAIAWMEENRDKWEIAKERSTDERG